MEWASFRSTLFGEFGLDPAVRDRAVFHVSLANCSSWIVVTSDQVWSENVLEAIFLNALDRDAELEAGGPVGRKKPLKEAMPLVIKVVRILMLSSITN
jgi:hypothetical protein